MACGGMGGCGGSSSKSSSNHAPKKMPNWGMTAKPMSSKSSTTSSKSNFGTPKMKMSFGKRSSY